MLTRGAITAVCVEYAAGFASFRSVPSKLKPEPERVACNHHRRPGGTKRKGTAPYDPFLVKGGAAAIRAGSMAHLRSIEKKVLLEYS